MSPAFFFSPLRIALEVLGLLWFHINLGIISSSSVKNVMGNLTGICVSDFMHVQITVSGLNFFFLYCNYNYICLAENTTTLVEIIWKVLIKENVID